MRNQPREQGAERPATAWSARSRAARMGLRALVLAGAAGVAWLLGSSVAHADDGDARPAVESTSTDQSTERAVATTASPLPTLGGSDGPGRPVPDLAPADPTTANPAGGPHSSAPADSQAAREVVPTPPDSRRSTDVPVDHPDQGGSLLSVTSASSTVTGILAPPGPSAAVAPSASPGTVTVPLATALRPVTGLVTDTVAPVSHTLDTVTTPAAPILGVVAPVTDTVATVTQPVTTVISDAVGTVTDPLPVDTPGDAGQLPEPSVPADRPALELRTDVVPVPVRPGTGDGTLPALDPTDLRWLHPHGAGVDIEQIPVAPAMPKHLPLQQLPRSGTSSGAASGPSGAPDGGTSIAVTTALPVSILVIAALLTTAYLATRRDLAGEPAVSPD